MDISHVYAGNPLDRGDRERRDEAWLKDKAKDPGSKFLPLSDLNVLIANGSHQGLGWLDLNDIARLGIDTGEVFLGLRDGDAYFAIDISNSQRAVQELQESGDWRFEDARSATEYLSGPDSGIVAQARTQINCTTAMGIVPYAGTRPS